MPQVPPVRGRRRGVLIGVLAAVVVLLVAAGVAAMPVYRALFVPPPTERVLAALDRLADSPMVRYRGGASVGETRLDGTVERLDLRVAADGAALGRLTRPSGHADLLARDGSVYLRGDRHWLLATDPAAVEYQTGHWLTADGKDVGLSVSALAPRKLAAMLRSGLRAGATTEKHQAVEHRLHRAARVGDEQVVPYTVPSGAVLYLSATAPYAVLGADVETGGGHHLSLDLTAGGGRDQTSLRHDVAERADDLDSDLDPAKPARYTLTTISWGHCGQNTCTLNLTAVVESGEDTSQRGYVVGVFGTSDEEPDNLGTCTGRIPKLTPGQTVHVACTNRSRAWREWPGGSEFNALVVPFSPGLDGSDPNTKLDLYRHAGFQGAIEAANFPDILSPAEAISLLNHLMDTVGWTPTEAITAVDDLLDSPALGVVTDLVTDGALEPNPRGLSVGDDRAASYVEAARRVKAGSKHVAVGNWTSHSRPYSADVVDISGRRLVWLAHTDSTKYATTIKDLRAALGEAGHRPVPSRFSREVRANIGTRSTLYRMDRDSLLTELRLGGITRSTMDGVGRLAVVAGPGTYTYRPSDFD